MSVGSKADGVSDRPSEMLEIDLVVLDVNEAPSALPGDEPVLAIEELGTARAGGIRNLDELEFRELSGELVGEEEEDEFEREAIRLANQSGSLGAVLGFGGMTLGDPDDEVETPGGSFTLGKADAGDVCGGVLLDCSRVRVKSCPLKAKVRVSLARSKAWASNSS
jgi:hypothetical protein